MPRATTIVAMVNLYLILSVSPINASRVAVSDKLATDLGDSQELVKEMQKAMQEDAEAQSANHNASSAYWGESWAGCEKRQEDFERRAEKTKNRYNVAKDKAIKKWTQEGKDPAEWDGKISAIDAGWVMLKARAMAKTIAAAKNYQKSFFHPDRPVGGCAWVAGKKADISPLKDLLKSLKPAMPCYDAAEASLNAAKNSEDQAGAIINAMQLLTSEECKAGELRDTSAEELKVAAAKIEKGGSQTEEKFKEVSKNEGTSELQTSELQTQATSMLEKVSSDMDDIFENVDMEDATQQEGIMEMIVGAFLKALGWVVLCIMWCLFCWVILMILMVVLGLIMCVFKILIVALIRVLTLNQVKVWDLKYGSCVSFWLGAMGHSGGGGDSIGIAMCAVGFLTR